MPIAGKREGTKSTVEDEPSYWKPKQQEDDAEEVRKCRIAQLPAALQARELNSEAEGKSELKAFGGLVAH